MSLKPIYILLFFLMFSNSLIGSIVDTLGFISPVDHQIKLTGNFMELRPNHFHAGIDIKSSKGVSGDNIRSVHNGHISRIRITSGSYGNALYIDHPNGYTSVYAHLIDFSPEVENYLSDIQYALETFEVDIYLPDSLFKVKKGELIGHMGNSGRSFGPHLHFELRKTKNELVVNPEKLGIGPKDTSSPRLESLHIHELGSHGEVVNKVVKNFKKSQNNHALHGNELVVQTKQIGLGLEMFDRMDGSYNKNGVYGFQLKVDNKEVFSWTADKFSFEESRMINGIIDFEKRINKGQKVYLLYRSACNHFAHSSNDTGIIDLSDGKSKKIDITITDIHKNRSFLGFEVRSEGKDLNLENVNSCQDTIVKDLEGYRVDILPNTLFSATSYAIKPIKKNLAGQKCTGLSIGHKTIPVCKRFQIMHETPKSSVEKWVYVKQDNKGRLKSFGSEIVNGELVTYLDEFGDFFLYRDTEAPSIEIINLEPSMKSPWKLKVRDNLIPDGLADDFRYYAKANNQWILFKFDKKNDLLIFDDFHKLPSRKTINFSFEAIDASGNSAVLKRTIIKQ